MVLMRRWSGCWCLQLQQTDDSERKQLIRERLRILCEQRLSTYQLLYIRVHIMLQVYYDFFFIGVPLMECWRVDDTSPENTIVGLPPGWVDTDVCRLYIGISSPQLGGTRAPSRSPPVSWWSQRRTDSSVMSLPWIWTLHESRTISLQTGCILGR